MFALGVLPFFLSFHLPGWISVILGGRNAGTGGSAISAATLPRGGVIVMDRDILDNMQVN